MNPDKTPAYDNVGQMTPLQMKRLAAVGADALQEVPFGFAQWLINGQLKTAVEEAMESKRKDWLADHSGLVKVGEMEVPAHRGGSFADRLSIVTRKRMVHSELPESLVRKIFRRCEERRAYVYRAQKSLTRGHVIACIGNARRIWVYNLTPLQVLEMIDSDAFKRWQAARIEVLSHFYEDNPVFLRLKTTGRENLWNVGQVVVGDSDVIQEGAVVVFRNEIF